MRAEHLRAGHADVGGGVDGLLRHEDAFDDGGVALVDALEGRELPADVVQAVDVVEFGFLEHVFPLPWPVSCGVSGAGARAASGFGE